MRTKKVMYNMFTAIMMQIITFIVGLILPKLIINEYGSLLNGLRASILQFFGYMYIIEMGLGGAIIFSLYKPLAENNFYKINSILSAAKKSYNKLGLYFSGLVVLMMVVYPFFVLSENIKYLEVVVLILSIGSMGIINYFTSAKYNVLLKASQSEYVSSLIRIVYLLINTILMIFLIKIKLSLSLVYFFSLGANVIQVLLIGYYTRKHYKYINFNIQPDFNSLSKRYDVLVHQISAMVVFGSPIILLTFFSSLVDVSIYSVYALVFTGINMIINVFNSGLTASFGQLIAIKDQNTLKKSYSQYELIYYMIFTFVFSCVIILGIPFLKIYIEGITDANYIDITVYILFVIIGILNNWKIPQSTIIVSAGHFRETKNRAIIEAMITIMSSTILVIQYGLKGVLVGSIVGLLYRSIDMLYINIIVQIPFRNTLIRLIRSFLTLVLAIIPFFVFIPVHPDNLITWIKSALLISVWVGVLVFIVNYLFEKETINSIISRFKMLFFTKIVKYDKQ